MSTAEFLEIIVIVIIPPLGLLITGLEKSVDAGLIHGIFMLLVFTIEEKDRERLAYEQQNQRYGVPGVYQQQTGENRDVRVHISPH